MNAKLIALNGLKILDTTLFELDRVLQEELSQVNEGSHEYMNQVMAVREIEQLMESLKGSKQQLRYVVLGVKCEDRLWRHVNGRYMLGQNELTCASPIEIFDTEDCCWMAGRVEHSEAMGGFYFYGAANGFENRKLGIGTLVRIRG